MADEPTPGGSEITIVNENLEVSMNAANRSDLSVPPLTEDDRTLRAWALMILNRSDGTEIPGAAEEDGEQKVVNYGKDASDNIDALRTNTNKELIVAEGRHAIFHDDPVEITLTNTDAIFITFAEARVFWVKFVNHSATTTVRLDAGIDSLGASGAINDAGSIIRSWQLRWGQTWGYLGPFSVQATDTFRAKANIGGLCNMHFISKRTEDI